MISEEYRREQERASRLYEKLRGMLPEDGRRLLLAYSEAAASAHCLETEILAERAFLDGIRLMLMAMEKIPARGSEFPGRIHGFKPPASHPTSASPGAGRPSSC